MRPPRLPDFGRLVLALQALAPALDGRDELGEVDLEGVEDLVGVVLGAEADLALAGAGVLDDVVSGTLGLLDDLLLGDELVLAVARLLDDALGLALGLGEHLLALLDDPARLLDLLGDRRAHLVEDVVDLLAVEAHLVRPRKHRALRVVDQIVELVDENEDVHRSVSSSSAGEGFLQGTLHMCGNELRDVAVEDRQLLHPTGGEETVLGAGHDEHRLDLRSLLAVELGHLRLVLEVADRAQPLDDRDGSLTTRELDDEDVERLDA